MSTMKCQGYGAAAWLLRRQTANPESARFGADDRAQGILQQHETELSINGDS